MCLKDVSLNANNPGFHEKFAPSFPSAGATPNFGIGELKIRLKMDEYSPVWPVGELIVDFRVVKNRGCYYA